MSILAGLLAMLLSLIALAVILLIVLVRTQREIEIGSVYLVVPAVAFIAGSYWSLRRSSRPKAPAKPPSMVTMIVKSTMVGVAAVIVSVMAYLWWIWFRFARHVHGLVGINVHRMVYWVVLSGIFLASFFLAYTRISRRRSMLRGCVDQ
jgi:hypothetical protein